MSEMKTFSGKNLDEAMEMACRHFKAEREKLEIEIITGGSTGIFGLVGKKKAEIRARLREEIRLLVEPAVARESGGAARPGPKPAAEAPSVAEIPAEEPATEDTAVGGDEAPVPEAAVAQEPQAAAQVETVPAVEPDEAQPGAGRPVEPRRKPRQPHPRPAVPREAAPERPPRPAAPPPAELSEELAATVREVMENLLRGILEEVPQMEISGNAERVTVLVLDEENSGLLIGREGQTLSSLQYLVNRIVARRHDQPVRVQINTGEYRERQDDNLRKMAVYLADKAKSLGRPQSTKPLSSYHRRVVHLALQEDETIQTRSKGDGPLKRVIIVPKVQRGESQTERGK